MWHIQRTVPNWLEAVQRLPDGALVKSIDGGQIFQEVKGINANINTCLRHWYDPGQVFGGTYAENKQRARTFFNTFIDGTFINQIAPHCDYIEEWNEYLANSQNQVEVNARLLWAQAAADVWLYEYRNRPELAHIRLALCNTAIGNDIPKGFFHIAQDYDALLSYHSYTYWKDGQRGDGDWRYLSGRWNFMEQQYGESVDWIFTEAGPYESAVDGWRSPNCLNGAINSYVDAVCQWIRDVAQTNAYAEGRVKGFALFTTGGSSQWRHFETAQPEMNLLADMIAQEWQPGTAPPPPSPPPDNSEVDYVVVVNLLPQGVTDAQYSYTRNQTKRAKETILQSADDAARLVAPGRPGSKVRVWESWRWLNDIDAWLIDKGVNLIEHLEYPIDSNTSPLFIWPVGNDWHLTSGGDGGLFDAPRSKYPGNHEGVDLFAAFNNPVYAVADGIVVWADNRKRGDNTLSAYGNHVIIDHENGYITWYAHLESMTVLEGSVVMQGATIGRAGSTGNSTGVHLHFSVQHIGHGLSGYVVPDIIDPGSLLGV